MAISIKLMIIIIMGKSSNRYSVCYNWPMSAHASKAFSIAHCTDSEDLPESLPNRYGAQ